MGINPSLLSFLRTEAGAETTSHSPTSRFFDALPVKLYRGQLQQLTCDKNNNAKMMKNHVMH